ncbi:MAG: type II toxin-antitoxin system RelE/ParE family toxin [Clostridia bacterium]|nr:type II toxin-antitoxin system RelE/ParE family toxin [Clostridia bacterium]
MNSKKEIYEIEFTEDCRDEIRDIYEYISKKLFAEEAAKRLMRKIKKYVTDLAESPELYMKIEKKDKRKRDFRRMVIDNYVILYTIDESNKTIYISHMYYGRKNYLNL